MLKAINLKLEEINDLVILTADKMKLPPAMVEKDFWVSYILEYLFNRCKYKELLEFKGGTSLSKGYSLIERFSEDIDIVLHIEAIEVSEEEFYKDITKNKQDLFNKNLLKKSHKFLQEEFYKTIKDDIGRELKHTHNFVFNEEDASISFQYPQFYKDPTLRQEIRIEVGVLGSWTPFKKVSISSFIAEYYPKYFITVTFQS